MREIAKKGIEVNCQISHPLMIFGGIREFLKTRKTVNLSLSKSILSTMDYFIDSKITHKLSKALLENSISSYDVIHLNHENTALFELIKGKDIPSIFTVHVPKSPEVSKEILNAVDLPVATSEFVAKNFEESTGFKPPVIYNGVDHKIFRPDIPRSKARKILNIPLKKRIIFWNSSIMPRKDPITMIRAFKKVTQKIPEAFLFIKGRAANRKTLWKMKKIINRENVGDKVFVKMGWIPYSKLPFYYRAADVYVHTSRLEGFSLAILEAMSSGIPVLGSNAASIPEALDKEDLFPPGDHSTLADYLIQILNNKDLRNRKGIAYRRKVYEKGFRWKDAAEKYTEKYRNVVNEFGKG